MSGSGQEEITGGHRHRPAKDRFHSDWRCIACHFHKADETLKTWGLDVSNGGQRRNPAQRRGSFGLRRELAARSAKLRDGQGFAISARANALFLPPRPGPPRSGGRDPVWTLLSGLQHQGICTDRLFRQLARIGNVQQLANKLQVALRQCTVRAVSELFSADYALGYNDRRHDKAPRIVTSEKAACTC